MIVFLLVVAVLVFVVVLRRRRGNMLAGRNPVKPTYMVEPPSRRVGSRRNEAL